jgi:hypothetical protein
MFLYGLLANDDGGGGGGGDGDRDRGDEGRGAVGRRGGAGRPRGAGRDDDGNSGGARGGCGHRGSIGGENGFTVCGPAGGGVFGTGQYMSIVIEQPGSTMLSQICGRIVSPSELRRS